MSFDVAAVRAHFPALRAGAAHFDGPGGSQVPDVVGQAVASALTAPMANRGRVTQAERNADDAVLSARQAVADLLGAEPAGVVFGRSATQLAYDFSRVLSRGGGPATRWWSPGWTTMRTSAPGCRRPRPGGPPSAGSASTRRPASWNRRPWLRCCPSAPGWWRSPAPPT